MNHAYFEPSIEEETPLISETSPSTNGLFRIAQAARIAFWVTLTGVLLYQAFDGRQVLPSPCESPIVPSRIERISPAIALLHESEALGVLTMFAHARSMLGDGVYSRDSEWQNNLKSLIDVEEIRNELGHDLAGNTYSGLGGGHSHMAS